MDSLKAIAENVIKGKFSESKDLVQAALDEGVNPGSVLNEGLLGGIEEVGRLFSLEEIYVPEMLMAAKAMQVGWPQSRQLVFGRRLRMSMMVGCCIGTVLKPVAQVMMSFSIDALFKPCAKPPVSPWHPAPGR